jgi:hypothetical protein
VVVFFNRWQQNYSFFNTEGYFLKYFCKKVIIFFREQGKNQPLTSKMISTYVRSFGESKRCFMKDLPIRRNAMKWSLIERTDFNRFQCIVVEAEIKNETAQRLQ